MNSKLFPAVTLVLLFYTIQVHAQNSLQYSITNSTTGSLAQDKNGNAINISAAGNLVPNNSTANAPLTAIGFDFVFMGKLYTHFIAGSDGQVGLGLSNSPASMMPPGGGNSLKMPVTYPPVGSSAIPPVLAAFWTSLNTPITGPTIRSIITGTAPNRCRVIEWHTLINYSSTNITGADGIFQIRMYETTSEIEYVYGNMSIGPSAVYTAASIGFTAGTTNNKLLALQNLTTFDFTAVAANVNPGGNLINHATPGPIAGLHSPTEGSRRLFRFTPPLLPGNFNSLQITDVSTSTMQLKWADNFSNESGFIIFRSLDNINYSIVAELPANATAYKATNLLNNTRYYWKVMAYTEGQVVTSSVISETTHCSLQGTITIGAGGKYANLTQAFDSLKLYGVTGPVVLELQSNYNPASETFPIVIAKNIPCRNAGYALTIRPAANVVNMSISTGTANSVFVLDSSYNVVIDGRPGGTGTAKALTLSSTGAVIQFNNAVSNTITNVRIQSGTLAASGVVTFNGTEGAGSDNNIINQCDISDNGSGRPAKLIYSSALDGIDNRNNQVIGCNLYNFNMWGLQLAAGSKAWTIKDNSFYSSMGVSADSGSAGMISISDSGYIAKNTIEGNFFGGTSPRCQGDYMLVSFNYYYDIISVTGAADIKNNSFARFRIYSYRNGMFVRGILASMPQVGYTYNSDSCSISGNRFGGAGIADSFTVSNDISSASSFDFKVACIESSMPARVVQIGDNVLQHINLYSYNKPVYFDGIKTGSTCRIVNNTIGTTAKGINNFTTGESRVILAGSAIDVSNNIITRVKTRGILTGIQVPAERATVSQNTVSYLTTSYYHPGGLTAYIVAGIAAAGGSKIIKNQIFALTNTANGFGSVVGIYENGGLISGNKIHSLVGPHTVEGIYANDAGNEISNNMIRLGLDSLGNSIVNGAGYWGIFITGNPVNYILHNTIHIAGSGAVAQAGFSACLVFSGTVYAYNNIFTNYREISNNTYAYNYILSGTLPPNQKTDHFDYNIYNYSGNTKRFASINYNPIDSFQQWRMTTGNDLHSIQADPNYLNANGADASVDLHLASPTPAEGKGTNTYTTATDFDGETRSSLSPIDIGADAAAFTFRDNWRPVLAPDSIPDHSINENQVITVKIKDDTGTDTSSVNKPVMWLRRFYPGTTAWQQVYGHLINGNTKNGTWRFEVDYNSLGLVLSSTDSIECYFVAKDIAPTQNIGYSPLWNNTNSNVNVQFGQPLNTHKYKIWGPLPDTLYVGAGQTYTSLTNDMGVFQAINSGVIGQNGLTVIITSDLNETGDYGLVRYPAYGSGRQLNIITNTPVVKNIYANAITRPLIGLNKCRNIAFDGSVNGSGRYLRFINSSDNSNLSTGNFYLEDSNTNIILKNLVIEGNMANNIHLVYANRKIEIRNNIITGATGNPGRVGNMSFGILGSFSDDNIKVIGNEISNFYESGIYLTVVGDSCVVDSNHVYMSYNGIVNYRQFGIIVNGFVGSRVASGHHIISNNYIGGSMPYCGGAPWTYSSTFTTSNGAKYMQPLYIESSTTDTSYIFNNTIKNIHITTTADVHFWGLSTRGLVNVGGRGGNIIGDPAVPNSILNNGTSTNQNNQLMTLGMRIIYDDGSVIANNTVANITSTATSYASVAGIQISYNDSGRTIIKNNTVRGLTANANSSSYAIPFSVAGIMMNNPWFDFEISGNKISDLKSAGTTNNTLVAGILVSGSNSLKKVACDISRNRIHHIENNAAAGGEIAGIVLSYGTNNVYNNQVALTNGHLTNAVLISGIKDTTSINKSGESNYYYNSIYIGGTVGSGNSSSYGLNYRGNNIVSQFKNNLLYSTRTGGTGDHLAIQVNPAGSIATGWTPATANYNFLIATDTANVAGWAGTGTMGLQSFRSISGGDASSFYAPMAAIPVDSIFADTLAGNLNINTRSRQSWYVNGKGLPIAGISGDFDNPSGVRSVSITSGPTDIGSDEFTPQSAAPTLLITGRHEPGGADTLVLNDRVVAIINWENAGTLPVMGTPRWYSGVWPNDLTNNGNVAYARYMSSFIDIPATGGSGYSYSLTLFYDSAMLGKITDAATMVINKRESGVPGSWQEVLPTVVDPVGRTMTIYNQTSFSEFTATDSAATLVRGIHKPDLVISTIYTDSGSVAIGRPFKVRFIESNTGNLAVGNHTVNFYLSSDAVLTPGANGDILLGEMDMAPIADSSTSGALYKEFTVPCTIAPGSYSVFVVADNNDLISEISETNNTSKLVVAITAGIVSPGAPVITVNPGTTVCSPGTITLTASSPGCTACTFTWNTGVTGNQLTVSNSGTYMVTVANACGTNSASQTVTVHNIPAPVTPVITANPGMAVCSPGTITLTASSPGCSNCAYTWNTGVTGNQITVSSSGTYMVTATNLCGTNNASQTVTVNTTITPSVQMTYSGCPSNTLTFQAAAVNAGNNPRYVWLVNNMAVDSSGPQFVLNNAVNGMEVACHLRAGIACASPAVATATTTVNCVTTAVPDIDGLESFHLGPNPTTGLVVVKMKLNLVKKVSCKVIDNTGRAVYTRPPANITGEVNYTIDLRKVPNNIYFVQMTVGGQTFTEKIVVVR